MKTLGQLKAMLPAGFTVVEETDEPGFCEVKAIGEVAATPESEHLLKDPNLDHIFRLWFCAADSDDADFEIRGSVSCPERSWDGLDFDWCEIERSSFKDTDEWTAWISETIG